MIYLWRYGVVLLIQHYDLLVKIWGGSANTTLWFTLLVKLWCGSDNTEPLNYEISSDDINDAVNSDTNKHQFHEEGDESVHIQSSSAGDMFNNNKRRAGNKLIDKNWKHLEKQLSNFEEGRIFLNEAKEDAAFRRDMIEAIKQSNESFQDSIKMMTQSISNVGKALANSIEGMSRCIMQQSSTVHIRCKNFKYYTCWVLKKCQTHYTFFYY